MIKKCAALFTCLAACTLPDDHSPPEQEDVEVAEPAATRLAAAPDPGDVEAASAAIRRVETGLRWAGVVADATAVVAIEGRRVIDPVRAGEPASTVYRLGLVDLLAGARFESCEWTMPGGGVVDGKQVYHSEFIDMPVGSEYVVFLDLADDGTCTRTHMTPLRPLHDGVVKFGSRVVLTPAELALLIK